MELEIETRDCELVLKWPQIQIFSFDRPGEENAG